MSGEQLVFNGIDALSGDYLLRPTTARELSTKLLGVRQEKADSSHLQELKLYLRRATQETLGPGERIDPRDLAQTGWGTAFQGLNTPSASCVDPVANPGGAENAGCIPGDTSGGLANLIAPDYRTPYAIHISGGAQHAFSDNWSLERRLGRNERPAICKWAGAVLG